MVFYSGLNAAFATKNTFFGNSCNLSIISLCIVLVKNKIPPFANVRTGGAGVDDSVESGCDVDARGRVR